MALGESEVRVRAFDEGVRRDPFPSTANPADYVSREATERALEALEGALEASEAPLALSGPPRLGKTLVARVLARRLEGRFRAVHLGYSALPPEPLCAWALQQLGHEPGANPEAALLEVAHRSASQGRPLLLVVDDGAALPVPTARGLCDLAAVSRGGLRLLVVASDQRGVAGVLAALGPELREIRLTEPMSFEESASYLRQRLERAGVPGAVQARFDHEELLRLHRESGGIPGLLHRLADQVLLRGEWLETGVRAPEPAAPPPRVPRLELEGGALEGARAAQERRRASGAAGGEETPLQPGAASPPPVPASLRDRASREAGGEAQAAPTSARESPRPAAKWGRALLLVLLAGMLMGLVVGRILASTF